MFNNNLGEIMQSMKNATQQLNKPAWPTNYWRQQRCSDHQGRPVIYVHCVMH